jgi:hypothetical protein
MKTSGDLVISAAGGAVNSGFFAFM